MENVSSLELRMFERDFTRITLLIRKLNMGLWRTEHALRHNTGLLHAYAREFSRKYRSLDVAVYTTRFYQHAPIITVDEHDLLQVLLAAAKSVGPISAVTLTFDGKKQSVSADDFAHDFPKLQDTISTHPVQLHFASGKTLGLLQHGRAVRIVLDSPELSARDPEFLLAAHYALLGGYEERALQDITELFIGSASSGEESFRGYAAGMATNSPY